MNEFFKESLKLHPLLKAEDVIKFCYQASFGAEHLLLDENAARKYFDEEYDAVKADLSFPLFEKLSESCIRVNFQAWKAQGKPKDELFESFVKSAKSGRGSEEIFKKNLENISEELRICSEIYKSPESLKYEGFLAFADEYLKGGIKPVHHSAKYRLLYNPHYRVLDISNL